MVESKAMAQTPPIPGENAETPEIDYLLVMLQRLDRLLEKAIVSAQAAYGPQAAVDAFRGLHISQKEVEQLLSRLPGVPLLYVEEELSASLSCETSSAVAPLTGWQRNWVCHLSM